MLRPSLTHLQQPADCCLLVVACWLVAVDFLHVQNGQCAEENTSTYIVQFHEKSGVITEKLEPSGEILPSITCTNHVNFRLHTQLWPTLSL